LKRLLSILLALALTLSLVACGPEEVVEPEVVNEAAVIEGLSEVNIQAGEEFDPLAGVTATDAEDGNITSSIEVSGDYDITTPGTYEVEYTVKDSAGETTTGTRLLTVAMFKPTGFYNFKFSNTELRHTLMAAAENYMLTRMEAGIPLYVSSSFALYSERLQLPIEETIPVMGFGSEFGTMSADDSTVLMENGLAGEAGKYTYRDVTTTKPGTFNQWLYDSSTDSDMMTHYFDTLYYYAFNADKTGYEVLPSMAADFPQPIDGRVTESGKDVSNTWQVDLRDDLVWTYFDGTDTSGFAADHEVIDANDFMFTFETGLTEGWFRAISGGGDFLGSSQAIVNAQEYVDGTVEFSEVGLKMIDENTLEFHFVNEMSEWNVKYWLSSFVMTPVSQDMYELDPVAYGTDYDTIAYHGAFMPTYYEADKVLRLEENPTFHSPERYFYTGRVFSIIIDPEIRFQEFLDGKLESIGVPSSKVTTYLNDPRLKKITGSSVRRLNFNGLGTVEAQKEVFPDSDYVPEPILANDDFQMAMFHVIDREKLALDIIKTQVPVMYLFSQAYLVDAELGMPYRSTEQGATVGTELSPETFGFNYDAARAYWKLAIDALIADGTYEAGTEGNETLIEMTYVSTTGSETSKLLSDYIIATFEEAFQDDEHHIKVKMEKVMTDFPRNYYDYQMIGEFDLADGGISGSTLDAASFLDVYASDNRGGFTLNWGKDSSVAEIDVVYTADNGETRYETWSFDAIASALNGEVYLSNGEEAPVPKVTLENHDETGFDLVVTLFDSPEFYDFTYTVQAWVDADGGYANLEGYVDLVLESGNTRLDLTATDTNELADYQVIVNWVYLADPEKVGEADNWSYLG
jgi:ABC-type oligopeptide transport system substrate-binding subunit